MDEIEKKNLKQIKTNQKKRTTIARKTKWQDNCEFWLTQSNFK
jgi:hypothetical protein